MKAHFVSAAALAASASLTLLVACTGDGSNDRPQSASYQNWDGQEQAWWYESTQGSRLMPYAWFQALEQPGSDQPFLADDHMKSFRFVPRTTSFNVRLPVGFAIDRTRDEILHETSPTRLRWFADQPSNEPWIGLNCSACHTAVLNHQGRSLVVDGGPSLVDFQSFTEAVDAALVATRDDPAKWERFAGRVLTGKDTPANRDMLRAALGRLIAWEEAAERLNKTPLRYGFARVDAFGHIYNKVALFTGAENPEINPADAPVSYPFLWDIYRHDRLQWNGIAGSARIKLGDSYLDYGAMGRNTGEVLGVFGDIVVKDQLNLSGYPSTVRTDNLNRLEMLLAKLRRPAWPADLFGATDPAKVQAGQQLYEAKCQGCHTIQPGTEPYKVRMVPLTGPEENRTDPWMACNAFSYQTASGRLENQRSNIVSGARIPDPAPLSTLLATTVKGALAAQKGRILAEAANTWFGIDRPPRVVTRAPQTAAERRAERLQHCLANGGELMAYKSRPLDGIWATAPYLHNGSVPTLYDLLLPAAQRPARFRVGTRDYDPVRVGYVTGDATGNSFVFDTSLTGNSNAGHDYRVGELTDAQRWALVEYMKTL